MSVFSGGHIDVVCDSFIVWFVEEGRGDLAFVLSQFLEYGLVRLKGKT